MFLPALSLTGQKAIYRGKVNILSYKTDNHLAKGVQAKVLANLKNLPLLEFDTLYRTQYMCEDTLITYTTGVNHLFVDKEVQIGSNNYLYDGETLTYLKMPLLERSFTGVAASDWKRYKERKDITPFDYNYELVPPKRQTMTYFAEVDESIKYPEQLKVDGLFGQIFHPRGRYQTLVTLLDSAEYVSRYTYEMDPELNCREHLADLVVRGSEIDLSELPFYQPDLGIIPEAERQALLLKQVRDTSRYGGTPKLAPFAGKFVYVDLWASWCAPCLAEMPFTQKLRERYPEDQLAIISIAMDSKADQDKWRKMIKRLGMDWVNWIIFDGLGSEFAKTYQIIGIPHYLLLDRQGRVMNADAPRPSDDRLLQLLDELLKQ